MKKSAVKWRPVAGAVFAGALAIGVGAFAAPRTGSESARDGKGQTRVQTETATLVSGSGEHLQAVVAGGAGGGKIQLVPVPARVGAYPGTANVAFSAGPYNRPLPKGTQQYNEISMDHGGFRIWAEWHYKGWDPDGNDVLQGSGVCTAGLCTAGNAGASCTVNADCDLQTSALMAGEIVGAGLNDSDINQNADTTDDGAQTPLQFAAEPCPAATPAGNTACSTQLGGSGGACVAAAGLPVVACPGSFCCGPMWYAKGDTRTDSICFPIADCNAACDVSSPFGNYRCFQAPTAPEIFHDNGGTWFGGYLALDIPATAKGRYFLDLNHANTYMADRHSPPADIPLGEESGMAVNIRVGSCCSNVGLGNEVCVDGLTSAECSVQATSNVNIWSSGKLCSAGCAECTVAHDPLCDDHDACTVDDCNTSLLVCTHALAAGFNPLTECCDKTTGVQTTRDDGDVCTSDVCSQPDSRGVAVNAPITGPCLDGNPCTTGDHCDGVRSQANGGCSGSDVNAVACVGGVCPVLNELDNSAFACDAGTGNCFCTLTPDLDYVVINSVKNPACEGGSNAGFFCEDDSDCPGGFCDPYAHGGNCFGVGEKISARVHIGSAGAPINGGEFLLQYDPSCVSLNSIAPIAPYTTVIYGPVYGNGSVFIAVGVDPFGGIDGPLGNADVLALSFTKTGACDECELCFGDNNPMHTYLTDNEGQRVGVAANCKGVRARPELTLDVPGPVISVNAGCNTPNSTVTWDAPSASSSCPGGASLTCRGAHESGSWVLTANGDQGHAGYMHGGIFPNGSTSICCVATENLCDQVVGCAGPVADCAVDAGSGLPEGCWTVTVNDETSLDINIQLQGPITHNDQGGEMTRCIKFGLFDGLSEPLVFFEDVTFGGLFNFVGKVDGKVKIPGTGKWNCITAQDQHHTLRSCQTLGPDDCVGGKLYAEFSALTDNYLIGGNLDGWKKYDATSSPSLNIIDILDFGTFVGQYGTQYPDNDHPCSSPEGANADINGDGVADAADYAFITRNFLVNSKACCGDAGASEPVGITEISVGDLNAMGLGDLAAADLNGDGVVNTDDMEAFSQGARPAKTNNNRGGKGVRSGR